jgi:hypothetical protein
MSPLKSSSTRMRTSAGPSAGSSYAVGSYFLTLISPIAWARSPLAVVIDALLPLLGVVDARLCSTYSTRA